VEDVLDPGDRIKVKVINITTKERRINLSLWQYQNETGDKGIEKGGGMASLAAEQAKAEAAARDAEEVLPGEEEAEAEPAETVAGKGAEGAGELEAAKPAAEPAPEVEAGEETEEPEGAIKPEAAPAAEEPEEQEKPAETRPVPPAEPPAEEEEPRDA
jgi:hypothetical protein